MDEPTNPEQPCSAVFDRHSADVCAGVGRMQPRRSLCLPHSSRNHLWLGGQPGLGCQHHLHREGLGRCVSRQERKHSGW